MTESVLPEFRSFARGARQATSVHVTVEALRGDTAVRDDEEALDQTIITGARIRLERNNSHTWTLKIGSVSDGKLYAEITSSARTDRQIKKLGANPSVTDIVS
jgi:hypothetical protein